MQASDRLNSDELALAAKVDDLLASLSGELDASVNPHNRALRSLNLSFMGWPEVPYNDESVGLWHDLLQKNETDIETLHHLAIAHHARAIDIEASKSPQKSNSEWEKALSYWEALWHSDSFWDRLAEKACPDGRRQDVDDLRQGFPEMLLRVHFDLAFDPDTPRDRANYHVGIAAGSPFPEDSKSRARMNVYDRVVGSIPPSVWQNEMLDPKTIKQGTDAIEQYLAIDPGYTPALADALRLQMRMMSARYSDLQAVGPDDQGERNRLLKEMAKLSDYWSIYFEQLVDNANDLDDDVRQKLCLWHRVMGQVLGALSRHEDSIRFFDQGTRAGMEDDDNRRICIKERGETMAHLARERASKDGRKARSFCDTVFLTEGLSPMGHLYLSQAYLVMDDLDTAEEVARAGMKIEPDALDFDAMQDHEHNRQRLSEWIETVRVQQLVKQALEKIEAEAYREAVKLLDEAISMDSATAAWYFHRCRCYREMGEYSTARKDIETFIEKISDPEQKKIGEEVRDDLREKAQLEHKFGSVAMGLRRKALEAYSKQLFEQAEGLLRQAISACGKEGVTDLEKGLALALTSGAVETANKAIENKLISDADKEKAFRKALAKLEEAVRLDKSNSHITQQRNAIKEALSQVELEKNLKAEFGTIEVLKARGKAIGQYNARNFSDAVDSLRKALRLLPAGHSAGRKKLETELSMALTSQAFATANAAGAGLDITTVATILGLLDEAVELDPSNADAEQLRETLRKLLPFR
jgi:tetratricopeptide (TPR) repeat protein